MTDLTGPIKNPYEPLVREALEKSNGIALVCIGIRNQFEIARSLEGFFETTIFQIFLNKEIISEDYVGCVVVGYNSLSSLANNTVLNTVQKWIRNSVMRMRKTLPEFQMLILSEKLPDPKDFTNTKYLWSQWKEFSPEQVWSIDVNGALIRYKLIKKSDAKSNPLTIWATNDDVSITQRPDPKPTDLTTRIKREDFGPIDQTTPKAFSD